MPNIRLTDICKTFPNRAVGLHPTTLTVATGSYFVLLGPSGSGKSTLLRLIAGLETPTAGCLHFDERPVHSLAPHERGIAYVPQRSALYPDRDVRWNIRVGLEFEQARQPRGKRLNGQEIDARVTEAACVLHIADRLERGPHELSGGEQRRVMLARALVRRAPIWLLDEPLTQLDAPLAEKLSRDLHLLQRGFALTIVHVTHDPNEAMALADRVGLLGEGRILQSGTPEEVYSRPGNRTVGLHFGRPAINLIEGISQDDEFRAEDWLRVPCPHRGPVTLGIRPEDVGFVPHDGHHPIGLCEVVDNQRHDSRILVTLQAQLRGFASEPLVGRVAVWVNPERLHWFAASTGERLNR